MGVFDVINEQGKRTYDLERDQVRGNPTTIVVGTLVVLGVPDSGAVTNPCKPRTSATLHEVTLELPLGETSPTDVTFDILKSGVSVGSVTITAGDDEGVALIDVGFSRGDQLTVQATTPGSGYTSMTGHLVWQTTRDWWHPPVLMFNVGTVNSFALSDSDESGPKGHLDLPIDVPVATTTITVTFTVDPANPTFVLDQIRVIFDPTGVATPDHSEFPGTAGPTDCAITGLFSAGPATLRVFAQSSGASPGDLVDYSVAFS